jgi:hypothetical protein
MKANESNRTERQQRVNVVGDIFVEVGNFWEFRSRCWRRQVWRGSCIRCGF